MNPIDARLRERLDPLPPSWDPLAVRRAAVLAPILWHEHTDHVLFLLRAEHLRQHAGQIGFPGGGDDGDTDPAQCALRETEEEIGVGTDDIELLGSLPARRSSSGFSVHCLVGRIRAGTPLRLDANEVARTLLVPLDVVADATRWQHRLPEPQPGQPPLRESPHLDWHGEIVWGLTGRLAWELGRRLRGDGA